MEIDHSILGVAFHEAGHAAISAALGFEVEEVSLTPDDPKRLGYCLTKIMDFQEEDDEWADSYPDEEVTRIQIMITLAGDIAEEMSGCNDTLQESDAGDHVLIASLLKKLPITDHDEELQRLRFETREMLNRPLVWAGVERLAAELVGVFKLTGYRIHQLLAEPAWTN